MNLCLDFDLMLDIVHEGACMGIAVVKLLAHRARGLGFKKVPVLPIQFQRLGIWCFQIAICLK